MARQPAIAILRAVYLYFFRSEGIRFISLIPKPTAGIGINSNLESIRLLAASERSVFYNALVDHLREFGRTLLFLGGLLVIIGALLFFGSKLPFRLGRLPGDIIHRGEHTTFYFPIVTCLVLSLALSFLFWLFSHFRR
jgi:hypothetical protein